MKNLDASFDDKMLDESFSNFILPPLNPLKKDVVPIHVGAAVMQAHAIEQAEIKRLAEANALASAQKLIDAEKALAVALAIEKTKEALGGEQTPTITDSALREEEPTNWLLIGGISTGVLALGIAAYFIFRKK